MRIGLTICGILLAAAPDICRAQISPGELSRAHEQLEGIANCTQCHEQGKEITGAKCLACHVEIRTAIESKHGLHFRNSSSTCVSCHKEHLGRSAHITQFDPKSFDHGKTGYPLNGKHAAVACESCHASNRIVNSVVLQSLQQHPRQTYLGLPDQCLGCHADRHGGSLGKNCRDCHAEDGWKPASVFNHGKTKFPLTGKHSVVQCVQCHETTTLRETSRPLLFTSKPFEDCTPCHISLHTDRLARRQCKSCHSAGGWSIVRAFDHSQTDYPLIGRHASVACARCHLDLPKHLKAGRREFATKPFGDCTPCHASPHEKSFSQKKCSDCHTSLQWSRVPEKTFDHSLTSFPLRGKHATVACQKCHLPAGKKSFAEAFKLLKKECIDCHEDFHHGQFRRAYGSDCSKCHTEDGYSPSTFSVERHAKARYALAGAHLAVPCRSCHVREKEFIYQFESFACAVCHADPHGGQFADLMKKNGCETCHSPVAWRAAEFDHSRTGYPLIGGHAQAKCNGCHKKPSGSAVVHYKGTTKECSDCHDDVHRGQFAEGAVIKCERCHSPNAWKTLLFKHNEQSSFHLTGGHENVKCGACHPVERIQGTLAVRYKPLDSKCVSCHTKE